MATVRVWFDVYAVPDSDIGKDSEGINTMITDFAGIDTAYSWDNVWWEAIDE